MKSGHRSMYLELMASIMEWYEGKTVPCTTLEEERTALTRHRRYRRAQRMIKHRRKANTLAAQMGAHRRNTIWFGSDGLRCYECEDIPLHRWEIGKESIELAVEAGLLALEAQLL